MMLKTSTAVAVATALTMTASLLVGLPAAAGGHEATGAGSAIVSWTTGAARHGSAPTRPARPESTGAMPVHIAPVHTVPPGRPATSRTTLTVTPTSGPAYQPVTLTVVVTSDTRVRSGAVTIRDGSTVLAAGVALDRGTATLTTNRLGPGQHVLTAELAGTAKVAGSTSAPVTASYGDDAGGSGTFNVVLTIPTGSLTITSPYTATRPLDLGPADADQSTSTFASGARIDDIVITDTRAGNQGFTASVSSSRFVSPGGGSIPASRAGFVDVTADQVPGNAMLASDVRVVDTRPGAPGLGSPRVFARYPAGVSIGTVHVHGTLAVTGVPSSVRAGRYLATLTFTAI